MTAPNQPPLTPAAPGPAPSAPSAPAPSAPGPAPTAPTAPSPAPAAPAAPAASSSAPTAPATSSPAPTVPGPAPAAPGHPPISPECDNEGILFPAVPHRGEMPDRGRAAFFPAVSHSRETPEGWEGSREAGGFREAVDGRVLRALVQEVLAEVLPRFAGGPATVTSPQPGVGQAAGAVAPAQPGLAHSVREDVGSVEMVSLRSDADLDAFVKHLLRLFENPPRREALRAGRLRFRLAPGSAPGSVRPRHRIEKGAVTEAMVTAAAKEGANLVLGPRAVLTPLARDRARSRGVEIEKER
jgi:hypothetical protein